MLVLFPAITSVSYRSSTVPINTSHIVKAEITKYRTKSEIAENLEVYLEMIRLIPTGIIRIKNKTTPKLIKSEIKTS